VDGLHKPLLHCVVFVFVPELLHLFSRSFWKHLIGFDVFPEANLVEVVSVVGAEQAEQGDALNDCEVFLLADVELATVVPGVLGDEVVVLVQQHFVASNFIRIFLSFVNGLIDPTILVDLAPIEESELDFGLLRLDLVGEALVLVDDHSSVLFNELLGLLVRPLFATGVVAVGHEKHCKQR